MALGTITTPNVPLVHANEVEHRRKLALATNRLLQGKSNNTGTITLTASAASTTLTDFRIGLYSFIGLMPKTANASAEIGAGTIYIGTIADGSATITHANNAQVDRTYVYLIVG